MLARDDDAWATTRAAGDVVAAISISLPVSPHHQPRSALKPMTLKNV